MLVRKHCNFMLAKAHLVAFWLFQAAADESTIGWDPISLWRQMGWLARMMTIILFIMSAWSIGVMIDRWIAFSAARKQSRQFAPAVAGALREGKLDEAIRVAERNKKSHLRQGLHRGPAGSKPMGIHRKFPVNRLKPASVRWSVPRPLSMPS